MQVSKTYQNWSYDETKAFEKSGKLYVTATCKCDRCYKGIFVCRIENGQPIPHPSYDGICLKCGGTRFLQKDIRLYTDKEFEAKEEAAEKAKTKKRAEQESQMKAEAEVKRAEWLEKNGFNENHETYIYFPLDSYDVKDALKKAGFKFSKPLLWHIASVPEEYSDKVIKISLDDIAEGSAWGDYHYTSKAESKIKDALEQARPHNEINSEWIGEIGERLKEIPVTLTLVHGFEGAWGYSQVVKFQTEEGNICVWFTTVNLSKYEIGDKLLLSGTVKDHGEDKYLNNAHTTILTRCKLKVA